jgi:hypothetical protein
MMAAPGPCGPTDGNALPTFEPRPSSPGSSNKPGPPAIGDPADGPPDGPPTPIKKRSGPPVEEKGTKFERQPQGSLDTAKSLDDAQASIDRSDLCEKRFFRQTVSAGFRTRVTVADSDRLVSQVSGTKRPSARDFLMPREVVRAD